MLRVEYICQGYLFIAEPEFNSEDVEFSGEGGGGIIWMKLKLGFNHGAILCVKLLVYYGQSYQ